MMIIIIIIIIINIILRGGLQSPRGGLQEGPLRKYIKVKNLKYIIIY